MNREGIRRALIVRIRVCAGLTAGSGIWDEEAAQTQRGGRAGVYPGRRSAVSVGTANFYNPSATIEVAEGIEAYMRQHKTEHFRDLIGLVY